MAEHPIASADVFSWAEIVYFPPGKSLVSGKSLVFRGSEGETWQSKVEEVWHKLALVSALNRSSSPLVYASVQVNIAAHTSCGALWRLIEAIHSAWVWEKRYGNSV